MKGLPTILLVINGECRFRMEGALTVDDLEELVNWCFYSGKRPKFFEKQVQELYADGKDQ